MATAPLDVSLERCALRKRCSRLDDATARNPSEIRIPERRGFHRHRPGLERTESRVPRRRSARAEDWHRRMSLCAHLASANGLRLEGLLAVVDLALANASQTPVVRA